MSTRTYDTVKARLTPLSRTLLHNRGRCRMSGREVAEAAEIGHASYYYYEDGTETNVSIEVFIRLAKVFRVAPTTLLRQYMKFKSDE